MITPMTLECTRKFDCTIISPDALGSALLNRELSKSASIGHIERFEDYPDDKVLARMLRLNAMDLLLIDCADFARAQSIIEAVRANSTSTEIVAICDEDVKILSVLMRYGVRGHITAGAETSEIRDVLITAIDKLLAKPHQPRTGGDIVAFLPSKPGTGASTIAANSAFLASKSDKKRVLLVDFDRDAPMQAFLNALRPDHFLQEALENAHHMDHDIWSRLISERGQLEILPCDAAGTTVAENGAARNLMTFCRRAYDLTVVDLPGPLDAYSVEVLGEAKRTYLTCTQELASIHIARRKAERMRSMGLGRELRVLVNRYTDGLVMTPDRISDLLGLPVELALPNSYALASSLSENGSFVDTATPLGQRYKELAQLMLNEPLTATRKPKSFLDLIRQPFMKASAISA